MTSTPVDTETATSRNPSLSAPTGQSSQETGYHAQRGSGASAEPARLVPGAAPPRRAVALGGEEGAKSTGARKRLAASALSPDPKVSEGSDTAKLREMVMAGLPK